MANDELKTEFTMSDKDYGNYTALRISLMSNTQQQRTLRNLARAKNQKAQGQNSTSNYAVDSFTWHRRVRLSRESRMMHLIRAYLKGTPYSAIEGVLREHTLPVLQLLFLYGNKSFADMIGDPAEFLKWAGYSEPDAMLG